jgi:hypothetical protein
MRDSRNIVVQSSCVCISYKNNFFDLMDLSCQNQVQLLFLKKQLKMAKFAIFILYLVFFSFC